MQAAGILHENPKLYLSYSDGTALLNAIASQCGLVTFYGQAPRTFTPLNGYNRRWFQQVFTRTAIPDYQPATPWRVLRPGRATGKLLGGYLPNLALMLGGRYLTWEPDVELILFLEDHERFSSPAAVAKYLAHLEQHALFNQVRGLVWGHYASEPNPIIDAILTRLGERHGIPVAACDDFGHGAYNALLPIGVYATLDTEMGPLRFEEPLVQKPSLTWPLG